MTLVFKVKLKSKVNIGKLLHLIKKRSKGNIILALKEVTENCIMEQDHDHALPTDDND